MPQEVRGITPDQIPALLAQHKDQLVAVNAVISVKQQVLDLFDKMEESIAKGSLLAAVSAFIEIQRKEYGLQMKGLVAQRENISSLVTQLENPHGIPTASGIIVPSLIPGGPGPSLRSVPGSSGFNPAKR